jgi:broad specificity phosphatase PhoE
MTASRRTFLTTLAAPSSADAQNISDNMMERLRQGGLVILMRHAETTPGIGDPDDFEIGRCETQRNLSGLGRDYARGLGERLRSGGVTIGRTLSSAWCRCVDTAKLMTPGLEVRVDPAFNSFFHDSGRARAAAATADARALMQSWKGPGNLLIVTHDVNIRAYVGGSVLMGGFKIVDPNGLQVIGTINP